MTGKNVGVDHKYEATQGQRWTLAICESPSEYRHLNIAPSPGTNMHKFPGGEGKPSKEEGGGWGLRGGGNVPNGDFACGAESNSSTVQYPPSDMIMGGGICQDVE